MGNLDQPRETCIRSGKKNYAKQIHRNIYVHLHTVNLLNYNFSR